MIRCSSSGGQNVWISQNPDCQVRLQPAPDSPETFSAEGGVGHLWVQTGTPGCHWKARSQADWMYVVGVSDWYGNLEVHFVVKENPARAARTGLIVVGETTWQVTQR